MRQRTATSVYTDETPLPQGHQAPQLPTRARPYEAPDDDDDDDLDAADDGPSKAKAAPVERPAPDAGSARAIALGVGTIIGRFLGKPVADTFTKAAAIEAMTGKRGVSFSKYTGCLEFRNALVLWVNIGGKDYRNVFSDGGARMTWYASPRNHEATHAVQRLLGGKDAILLFCRLDGEPYVCCGRLEYLSHVPTRQPLKFEWRLADASALQGSEEFRELISAAD